MIKLTEELKEFITRPEVVKVLATVSGDGCPNIGPKATLHVYDDESLAYMEVAGGRHWENVRRNPQVTVACIDWGNKEGYRLMGRAEVHEGGEVYEKILKRFFKPDKPPPKAGIRIRITEMFFLRPGRAAKQFQVKE